MNKHNTMEPADDDLAERLDDGRLLAELENADRRQLVNFAMLVTRNYVELCRRGVAERSKRHTLSAAEVELFDKALFASMSMVHKGFKK